MAVVHLPHHLAPEGMRQALLVLREGGIKEGQTNTTPAGATPGERLHTRRKEERGSQLTLVD